MKGGKESNNSSEFNNQEKERLDTQTQKTIEDVKDRISKFLDGKISEIIPHLDEISPWISQIPKNNLSDIEHSTKYIDNSLKFFLELNYKKSIVEVLNAIYSYSDIKEYYSLLAYMYKEWGMYFYVVYKLLEEYEMHEIERKIEENRKNLEETNKNIEEKKKDGIENIEEEEKEMFLNSITLKEELEKEENKVQNERDKNMYEYQKRGSGREKIDNKIKKISKKWGEADDEEERAYDEYEEAYDEWLIKSERYKELLDTKGREHDECKKADSKYKDAFIKMYKKRDYWEVLFEEREDKNKEYAKTYVESSQEAKEIEALKQESDRLYKEYYTYINHSENANKKAKEIRVKKVRLEKKLNSDIGKASSEIKKLEVDKINIKKYLNCLEMCEVLMKGEQKLNKGRKWITDDLLKSAVEKFEEIEKILIKNKKKSDEENKRPAIVNSVIQKLRSNQISREFDKFTKSLIDANTYHNWGKILFLSGEKDKSKQKYKESFLSLSILNEEIIKGGIFYQFRGLSNDVLLSLIEKKLYFSNPRNFNDPFDSPLLYDENVGDKAFQEVLKKIRITCFSFRNAFNNNLLWSHYAYSHRGVAIGYSFPESLLEKDFVLGKVDYADKVNYGSIENLWNGFLTKEKKWEYEEEYRLMHFYEEKDNDKPCLVDIKDNEIEIAEVIFGLYSQKYRQSVYSILNGDKGKIKFYEMKKDRENQFALYKEEWNPKNND